MEKAWPPRESVGLCTGRTGSGRGTGDKNIVVTPIERLALRPYFPYAGTAE